jgi:RNA polymerase sigma factor (sigma-70 family)
MSREARPRRPRLRSLESEQRDELVAAIAALAPDERLAVIGRFFLGLTDEEAAAALGIRRGAVKMRVFRAQGRVLSGFRSGPRG